MAATIEMLEHLHEVLTNALLERITQGEIVYFDGVEQRIPCNAATLNVARQFLRDNGIACHGQVAPDLQELAEAIRIRPVDEESEDATTA